MASMRCSCHTNALRTFVRSVAQAHFPNDNLASGAPWHETRRQFHQRGTARRPAVNSLPYRPLHTSTPGSGSLAVEGEDFQSSLEGQKQDSTSEKAAAASQSDAPDAGPAVFGDLLAEEVKLFQAVRFSDVAKKRRTPEAIATQPEAKPALPIDLQHFDEAAEDPGVETFSVAEIEAEQKERMLNRLRKRAERAEAKEQDKKEKVRQREEERARREKERLKARPDWRAQKEALKAKFPEGWRPRKKLSPDALNGIRALNKQFPETYTTGVLANRFQVSPEAIRRILRSKWEATPEEEEDRERRWHNRGVNIWQHYAAIGKKPPAKWREAGVVAQPRREQDWGEKKRALYDRSDGESRKKDALMASEQKKRLQSQKKLAKYLL